MLDRHLGATLLRYVLNQTPPTLDASRIKVATDLVFEDLDRQGIPGLILERSKAMDVSGIGEVLAPILATKPNGESVIVGLSGPLTPGEPLDSQLKDVLEYGTVPVVLEDELVVRRALPVATKRLIDHFR